MESRNIVLSLAIAAVLVGCGAPEKQIADKGTPSEGQTAPVVEKASTEAVVAKTEPPKMDEPVAAPAAAPVRSAEKSEPEPVKKQLQIPTDPNTFLITSSKKTKQHPEYGHGQDSGFSVNGVEGKELVLERGKAYKFIVDTGVQHDFYFTTAAKGWGAGTYSEGVEGQFVYKGEVTFTPNENTPDLLYYQCRNHKNMGGKIYIINKGQDVAKLKASLAAAQGTKKKSTRKTMVVTESAVKQKLGYAQMVLGSGSAKRVEASGNPEAISILNDARKMIDSAKSSLAAGSLEEAMDQVNEGLRMVTAASRAITTEAEMSGVNHKAKYDELLGSLNTYEGSYKKNLERAKKMKQDLKTKLDEAAYNKLTEEGKSLGKKGDYIAANKSLEKAQAMITSVLTDMLHAQTVVYDKSFDTPEEEYEYELARLENYEELVPLAIEQKQPSQRALDLIDGFVKKAAKIKAEGKEVAAKGDFKMAVMAMQAATSNLQRALRIAGVN